MANDTTSAEEATPHRPDGSSPGARPLSTGWRCFLSVLIFGHVMAIFVPPFTVTTSVMGPTGGSPVAVGLMSIFRPYCDFTFLNHGYAFFAPDPGPSHLVRAHLEFADGTGKDVVFPNLQEQRPRLLYHRHFMLSETLNRRFVPPTPPIGVSRDSDVYRNWEHDRKVYEAITQSFERHLVTAYGAKSAVLTRIEHRQPDPDEFEKQSIAINAQALYRDLPETVTSLPTTGRGTATGELTPPIGGRRRTSGARP